MKIKKLLKLFLVFALTSCTMAPKYKRPENNLPFEQSSNASKKKITQITWQEFFQSPDLQRVIELALKNNYDLKIANLNIEKAQATHDIARANLLPTANAVGFETRQGVPKAFASFTPKKQFRANVSVAAYELDFFGRLRSLKKSAWESFLASQEARNVIQISLISETVNSYAQLLVDREILKIMEENIVTQTNRHQLIEKRYKNGLDSQVELLNAKNLLENAKNNRETYAKLVKQDKNALMFLTGSFDEKLLPQDVTINDIKINEDLLDFIPSQTLLSRPDVQQAEHQLKSANADIGAARAAFFPSITLTGNYGYGSRDLSSLFSSPLWSFTPQINLPIFTGGKNIANLKIANLEKKIEIVNYEKAIQTAFREALDQLAIRETAEKQLKSFDEILTIQTKNYNLAEKKNLVGISSKLNSLDAKVSLLSAKQNQANMKKEYIANLISLYKVLGGGSDMMEREE